MLPSRIRVLDSENRTDEGSEKESSSGTSIVEE